MRQSLRRFRSQGRHSPVWRGNYQGGPQVRLVVVGLVLPGHVVVVHVVFRLRSVPVETLLELRRRFGLGEEFLAGELWRTFEGRERGVGPVSV